TSGSTGTPKGVMIEHRGAVNTLLDVNRRFAVGPEDRVLAVSALSFDLSVYDVFGLLAAGGSLTLPRPEAARDPEHWLDLMHRDRVTIWNSAPALLEMLVEHAATRGERLPASLRLVLLSGDWIPVSLPGRLRTLAPGAAVVSLGGATEASIWSILYPIAAVDPAWRSIPYGRPMDNQGFHVLNRALAPCPVWVPGDLYISGTGLARGYWRDPAKTAASFFLHPGTGERLYRTGDLGRYLPGGDIEFLGRDDLQVKIQGFRIELGE
ncbi:MAG TPA: non-ribosomal peptide synthetase, partial [Acidobacteria bacterium]|nr:non-ribosomal peptide synthetase [Acidobacteriota bacterium]